MAAVIAGVTIAAALGVLGTLFIFRETSEEKTIKETIPELKKEIEELEAEKINLQGRKSSLVEFQQITDKLTNKKLELQKLEHALVDSNNQKYQNLLLAAVILD